jgi:hypothetical protein
VRSNGIDVYDGNFNLVNLGPHAFMTPPIDPSFTRWNVQNLNQTIYVTYAHFTSSAGYVAAFDLHGNFLRAIGTDAPAGTINQPWGLAIAPPSFGPFANALLVGNFGDGMINAFDPATGHYLGQLLLPDGTPFSQPGLWALIPGNGFFGGDTNSIYFCAGGAGENQGLFGSLTPPGSMSSSFALAAAARTTVAGAPRSAVAAAVDFSDPSSIMAAATGRISPGQLQKVLGADTRLPLRPAPRLHLKGGRVPRPQRGLNPASHTPGEKTRIQVSK